MSSLSEMRAAVSEQESINRELRQELYRLSSGVSSAQNKWGNLTNYINNTLATGNNRMVSAHDMTIRAYEVQGEIEEQYRLYKHVELANKKIREANNKVYYDFANYRAVRKIVQAMLNNLEVSFVSDDTITKAVEVKHLQFPDYWLTCVLLSIMAWKKGDNEVAQRALDRAYTLNKKDTAIFFFAFYLRLGKDATALKWFSDYTSCARTGEDQKNILLMFAIAKRTLAEQCDDRLVSEINGFIRKLIDEDLKRSGYDESALVERIRNRYLASFRDSESITLPLLANHCKENLSFLKSELNEAKANVKILDFILKVSNVTSVDKNNFLNTFIDDLIARTNQVEKDVAYDIRYNEMVIAHGGHVDAAKEEFDAWVKHNETEFEMISEMVDWIYTEEEEGVNPTTRQMMFTLTKHLTEQAVDLRTEAYRSRFTSVLPVTIQDYNTVADLRSPASEDGKITGFYDEKARTLTAQEKVWPAFVWFGVGAAAAVGAFALGALPLLVGTAAGAVGGVAKILMTSKNKKRIGENCAMEAARAKETFRELCTEFSGYEAKYKEFDAYHEKIKEALQNV